MLETAVADRAKKLGLQEEVAEASRVNTDIAALLVDVAAGSELALLAVGGGSGGLVSVDLLIGVIDEIFLGRHDGGWERIDGFRVVLEGLMICFRRALMLDESWRMLLASEAEEAKVLEHLRMVF